MRITAPITLPALLTAAASPGGASLALGDHGDVTLPLGRACELVGAYTADMRAYGLGLAPPVSLAVVTFTGTGPDDIDATIASLRYGLTTDPGDEVMTLCLTPGCNHERLGRTLLTSVCETHLDTIVPGLLPTAGDDALPADRENAAADSRARRANAFAEWATQEHHHAEGQLTHARQLLEALPTHA